MGTGGPMSKLDSCPCTGANLPRYVQPVLLALLAREPMYGYSLIQTMSDLNLFSVGTPDVTGIYRKLREMERSGVLATKTENSAIGPSRKIYSVTELGMQCIERWQSSLASSVEHLESVIAFIRETGKCSAPEKEIRLNMAPAPACSCRNSCDPDFAAFVQTVKKRGLAGLRARKEDILRLLAVDPDSAEAAELGRQARDVATRVSGNAATIWAAIGVDCVPCTMNCSFCAFGDKWGVITRPHEWSQEEIVKEVKHFVDDGAAWIILRTTEHYGEERLRVLMRQVSTMLPEGCILVANTSQLSLDALTSLKETGVQGIYHALRLGEGRDTPFVAEKRRKALARIPRAGLVLAHLVEPLGIEHSNEEIAACFMAAQAAGAGVCGVMARNNVPGTPFEKSPTLPDKRLAQVAAVTRLCGGLKMPWICVHPPVPQALAWGANVVVVETGAVPRDSEEAHTEWKNFTIADARKLLAAQGYSVHKTVY